MEVSLLASITNNSNEVVFWDLNKKAIYSKMVGIHSQKQLSDIHFMPNEPVLISSSE